ncbi:hypothetical protein OC861_002209 [Tilletia horrida]|nr:hypothetical protein OC845_002043 [Tilletia horrida]KAK0568190.1 hypothetical protein OC861_002209 [Tilletia horrida]
MATTAASGAALASSISPPSNTSNPRSSAYPARGSVGASSRASFSTSPPVTSQDPRRYSLLRSTTATSSSSHASSALPQPIDFSYSGSSIRPYLSTSYKTSAERSFSGGPDAARFREPTQNEEEFEDDDMLHYQHTHHQHIPGQAPDPDSEGVFPFSSPFLGTKPLADPDSNPASVPKVNKTSPDPANDAQPQGSVPGSFKSEVPHRIMSPAWAATTLGRMTLGSPDIRPAAGTSPLPTLSSLGPSSISALGTSPAGVSGPPALAQRRLSQNRPPHMRDVYGNSPSSGAGAGLYGVSPGAANRLSSSLPAASALNIVPGTSPSSGNSGSAAAGRRVSHLRPTRPGLVQATSSGSGAAASTRQGPYSRPSYGPGGTASNRSHSRTRLSFSQQSKDGVDRNTSGLGLLGAAALAEAASPPFALRPARITRGHSPKGRSIVDGDVDNIDFVMEDIEGPFVEHHKHSHPSSSDIENSDLEDDDDEDDEHVRDEMMLSLVNEVDDAEATEDESEEIKAHLRTSGASSYTALGPGSGMLAQVQSVGAQRNSMRSVPTAVPTFRARSSRHSVGGTPGGVSGPSSLGLNFREAHGHAPHHPYTGRGLPHHTTRSPRLGGAADLEAAFPTQVLSSSPIYSTSVPTHPSLQRQLSAEHNFSHASALAAMRHYPYGSSPGAASANAAAIAAPPRTKGHRRTQSAQTEDDGSEFGQDSRSRSRVGDVTTSSAGGMDENAEVAMIRDRLGGAAHCSAFISKLWYLLINPNLYSRYIRWSEAGDSIILSNDPDVSAEFANDVLPKLFKHGNNASFIRQLNLYGFQRVPSSRLLDVAEQKAAALLQKERDILGFSGGNGASVSGNGSAARSSSRTRHSESSPGGAGAFGSGNGLSTSAGSNSGAGAPMTTALHLYGPHSSFAHPSFRRGQESLLPSLKPRSSKKPKGAKGAGGAGADGKLEGDDGAGGDGGYDD